MKKNNTYKTSIYNQYQIGVAIKDLKIAMHNLQEFLKYTEELDALEKDITNTELMQKVTDSFDYIKELQERITEEFETVESWHYNELENKESITED